LNLEQLTSYEQEESSRFDQYLKRVERGETGGYPEPERFRRLTEPVGKRATDASLWPQIPLFGSLTVPLFPVNEADFSKTHLFDVADLPRLVELCKESGHVQFILAARPTMFAGLDYLDVVLQDLAPPVVRSLPSSSLFDQTAIKRSNIQFDTIGSISFWPWFKSSVRSTGLDESFARQNYGMLREVFTVLNLMGYHKTVADVSDSIVSDPVRAYRILHFYNMFVEGPVLDPTPEVYCFSREYVKSMKSLPGPKSESTPLQFRDPGARRQPELRGLWLHRRGTRDRFRRPEYRAPGRLGGLEEQGSGDQWRTARYRSRVRRGRSAHRQALRRDPRREGAVVRAGIPSRQRVDGVALRYSR